MATVFEPIRPVPPITTIFMGYPACRRFKAATLVKAATLAKNLRGFPHRRKHRSGRLGSTELCNARGIRGSCGGNVSIERRRRDAEVTPMPELASLALAASMSVPTETRGLVLGSDHNGGMSRHSDLMIARARLRWLGEVRQMSAIGVRRDKAALSSGCKAHPANRSSRKQSEQSWRQRNGLYELHCNRGKFPGAELGF